MEIFLQVFLVKWSERFSMAKIILISYTCYTIAAIGYGFQQQSRHYFYITLFSHWWKHRFKPFTSICFRNRPTDKRGLYFSIYGLHWDISRTCGPVLGAVLLSKLNGSMLFYICACFLIIGALFKLFLFKI